jgi:hypothetical protein
VEGKIKMKKFKEYSESLRKDVAKLSSKFPERSKVRTKDGKKGTVVSVGRDHIKVAHGNRMKDYHPSHLTNEEMTTAADAGIPHDTANMGPRKKKRYPITRRFIEIMGRMRKIEK